MSHFPKKNIILPLHPTNQPISLLKYSKSSCGVDFLLNTAESSEKRGWFDTYQQYKTDFFEFYFFRQAEGQMWLAGKKIELQGGTVLIISPISNRSGRWT